MHEILNNQRKIKIDLKIFSDFLEKCHENISDAEKRSAAIAFVSDRKMRELNRDFRGKDKTTDVLSFPFEADEFDETDDFLGDIIISLEQAARQAAENNLELELEIKQLILHGILHLCGYDHETDNGEMNSRELELRDKLNINQ
ncbi:MAG TPA: rRNA maturation RNase YbeY [Pyrinomonadaceae bacterium]|nr:rRNA maturation RNase YbeY [Pyrinomonadaceae bacterium]